MTVLVTNAVPPGLRGELSRWVLEVSAGVFVGNIPARVRDRLWQRTVKKMKAGDAVMIVAARNEQGFTIRVAGDPTRVPVDYEGITLVQFEGKHTVDEENEEGGEGKV